MAASKQTSKHTHARVQCSPASVGLNQARPNKACASFVDYIADEQRQILVSALAGVKFFSLQADGSTDAGNVEDELFLVLYFDPHAKDGKVHVHDRFLTVRQPKSGNAEGLFKCFKNTLSHVGLANWEDKLSMIGLVGAMVPALI